MPSAAWYHDGMQRHQIQLDEATADRLRQAAARKHLSFSGVVREAVEAYLEAEQSRPSLLERWGPAIGKFRDIEGRTDVAERHDEFAWDH